MRFNSVNPCSTPLNHVQFSADPTRGRAVEEVVVSKGDVWEFIGLLTASSSMIHELPRRRVAAHIVFGLLSPSPYC